MPWPIDHKARTRQRIVEAAAAAFRAGGVSNVRVEDVMGRAGLTHGGFYAHFASKDELLREAIAHASSQTVERLSRPLADVDHDARVRAVIDAYLSLEHLAHPEIGCPIAALGPELVREGGHTRRHLAKGLNERLVWMRRLLHEGIHDAADEQVIGIVACMVGGLILARTVGAKDADTVLRACRRFLHQAVERRPARAKGARQRATATRGRSAARGARRVG